jgi:hypothetical protein
MLPRMIRVDRVAEITDTCSMAYQDGSSMDLPFPVQDTLFIHCSAGAFNFIKSNTLPPPIFENKTIVVQDVHGTPAYCFVGSMLGKLESMTNLSDEERNRMTLSPTPSPSKSPSGASGGDVGTVTKEHTFVQRAQNLQRWLQYPELSEWMFQS